MKSQLSELQTRVLEALRGVDPPWTLTGGGALAGFHLGHRTTRDLDLFFHGASDLGDVPRVVEGLLRAAGITVSVLRSAPSFRSLDARDGGQRTLVDLVADPVATIESPIEIRPGIWVDTLHEILVNKLCAVLGRAAIRDLVDIGALLDAGGDFDRALRDAPLKDSGFSPPTLAWLLRELDIAALASSSALDPLPLVALRDSLVARLLRS